MNRTSALVRPVESVSNCREATHYESFVVRADERGRTFCLDIDPQPVGSHFRLALEFPFPAASLSESIKSLIAAAAALPFGALCLAQKHTFQDSADLGSSTLRDLESLYGIAYDARCMAAGIPLRPLPTLGFRPGTARQWPRLHSAAQGVVLLFSGGLDSTIAAWNLSRRGVPVRLLHVAGVNMDAIGEEAAARAIARKLGLSLDIVRAEWNGLAGLGKTSASGIFGRYPDLNSIPFGRDLLLAVLGLAFASRVGATYVCLAHEYDIWHRAPSLYMGRAVYRTELATETAGHHLDRLFRRVSEGVHGYGSPIAPWTKYRLFQTFVKEVPALLPETSFCYWGTWCGQCPKCMTYGLLAAERRLDLPFSRNPLEALAAMEDAWGSSAKGPMVGSGLREPLGLASMVALDELLRTGRLPKGPAFERFQRSHAFLVGDRAAEFRSGLMARRNALLCGPFSCET